MEKNISLNLSLVKMPHSNYRFRVTYSGAGEGKCPCGQTFWCGTEKELNMKLRLHRRFCSKPPVGFDRIVIPKKACTLREQQLAEAKRIRKVHN